MTELTDELLGEPTLRRRRRAHAQGWHVERNISVGVILVLVANIAGGIWFAAKLDERVAHVEEWTRDNRGTEHRLTEIETMMKLMLHRQEAHR